MNKNHISLINKLTPILWEPGHMGAFFGRFLFDSVLEKSNLDDTAKKNYNKKKQGEWHWDDITGEYFQFNQEDWKLKLHESWEPLKQIYPEGLEFDAAICYILAQKNYRYYTTSTLLPAHKIKIPYLEKPLTQELMDMATNNFEFDNLTFPYVKSHIQGKIKYINQFPWKKKVACRFPRNKAWICDLLLFYKHYWFYILNPERNRAGFMEHNKHALTRPVKWSKHFLEHYDRYNTEDLSGYIIIDMYELIFNEQYEQVKLIDDQFVDITETQRQLLKDARQGTIDILNIFGLSHTSDIITEEDHATKFLTKEVINIYNMIKE